MSRPTWEPVALELIDVMQARQVAVVDYTLLDYVTTVHVTMTTSINAEFHDAVDNLAKNTHLLDYLRHLICQIATTSSVCSLMRLAMTPTTLFLNPFRESLLILAMSFT